MTLTDEALEARVAEYLRRPYRVEIYWDEDYWAAEFPELPGLVAGHETWEGLGIAIEDAKRAWFESMLEQGKPISDPGDLSADVSGKLQLRLPKSLHREVSRLADRDGVSLNTVLVTAIAKEVGRREPGRGKA